MHNQEWRDQIEDQGIFEDLLIGESDDEVRPLKEWAEALGHVLDERGRCTTCGRGMTCPLLAFYDAMISSVIRELDREDRISPEGVHFVSKMNEPSVALRVLPGEAVIHGLRQGPENVQDSSRGPWTWCEHDDDRHGSEKGCADCRCIEPRGHSPLTPARFQELQRQRLIESLSPPQDRSAEDRRINDPFGLWGSTPSYRCGVGRHRDCEPEGPERGCTCSCGHQELVCACGSRTLDEDGLVVHDVHCPMGGQE